MSVCVCVCVCVGTPMSDCINFLGAQIYRNMHRLIFTSFSVRRTDSVEAPRRHAGVMKHLSYAHTHTHTRTCTHTRVKAALPSSVSFNQTFQTPPPPRSSTAQPQVVLGWSSYSNNKEATFWPTASETSGRRLKAEQAGEAISDVILQQHQ